MKVLADSSALAKRYIREAGSEEIHQILPRASQLACCVIVTSEIISGLNRRIREGYLTAEAYRNIKKQLQADVGDSVILHVTPAVISHTINVLENNTIRAMDALHVACALEWQADLFITADHRQCQAARNAGLLTELIGDPLPR